MVPLVKLATSIQYGISERAKTAGFGVPMIRMNNLQANGWDLSDLKHIELDDSDLDRYRLLNGDLLFNRIDLALTPVRIDHVNKRHSYTISNEILEVVNGCGLLIADLTQGNKNICHEVGFLMGLTQGRTAVQDQPPRAGGQPAGPERRGYRNQPAPLAASALRRHAGSRGEAGCSA
jgi:hypothetical protein